MTQASATQKIDMQKHEFNFELPIELIAQYPNSNRSDARMLIHNCITKTYTHDIFKNIVNFLKAGDLLVLNDSKVIPARLYGYKGSGGKVELLIERISAYDTFIAHIKASKTPRIATVIHLNHTWQLEIIAKIDDLYHCKLNGEVDAMLAQIGHIPLPPYINRADEALDFERYQTIYAMHKGSVAAPTAGLHFDTKLLTQLQTLGINIAYTTLHVGAGTFRPVRCDNIKNHKMHSERFIISPELCAKVNAARTSGQRIIAVGTTALRSLESAASNQQLEPCERETDIFIYPGYQFKICDGLITNFHLPESTLLMLVAAFVGFEQAMELYRLAIALRYNFFSYGDTSLLLRR